MADRGFATMWIAVVMLYLAGCPFFDSTRWNEQTYFTIMWIWTLAPIALTGLVFTYLEAGQAGAEAQEDDADRSLSSSDWSTARLRRR